MKRRHGPESEPESRSSRQQLGIVDALAQLSFLVQGALGRVAAEHDLSLVQTRLLGALRGRSPGMNELARHLELDKSSVTGLVDRAEQRGFVRRKASAADRRAIEVSITTAGRKLAHRVEGEFEQRVVSLVQTLTETERAILSELASRIVVADARDHGIELSVLFPEKTR
jgi:MarR family transcriptional regulator, lower aerobic nicotinate degradation pathway regulator